MRNRMTKSFKNIWFVIRIKIRIDSWTPRILREKFYLRKRKVIKGESGVVFVR